MRSISVIGAVLLLAAPAARAQAIAPAATTATADPGARAAREIPRLRSADPREREAAARALAAIGRDALPTIRAELEATGALSHRLRALEIELDPRAKPRPEERWYEAKLREAALRIDRGDHLGAWKILDAILVLEPDCPVRDRIHDLRRRSRELYLRANIVAARIVPKKVLVAPGEPIELTLEVKNVSGHPLDIAFSAADNDLAAALDVELFRATERGDRVRLREMRTLHFEGAKRLGPNDAWTTAVTLPPLDKAPREVFRRLTISGSLRPNALARGEESFFGAILPVFPVDVVVVDPAFRSIAADPAAALRETLAALRAPNASEQVALEERLFFAALIGATTARDPTVDALALALGDGDPAADAAIRALAVLADLPAEKAALIEWLRRR